MSKLRMKRIRTIDELDDIQETWQSLERVESGAYVFQSWIWNRTWCDYVLSSLKHAHPDVRILEDGAGRIIAILPFFEEALAGPMARTVQFLGHRMSFHNDVLLSEPKNSECADEVVHVLCNDLSPRTILHLRHLGGESVFTQQLYARGVAESQCPRILIMSDPNIKDQAMRLGKSTRKTFRNRVNKLRRTYDCEFRVRSGNDLPEAFDQFMVLHKQRFDSINRTSLLEGKNLEFLRAAIMKTNKNDRFEIVQLVANGSSIAMALMAHSKQRYFNINIGFDPEYARYAPMRLLLFETMRHAFDELGCESYDFGPGYETYKYDWSPSVGSNYFCSIGGSGPYAKSLAAIYRAAFRRKLPKIPKVRE